MNFAERLIAFEKDIQANLDSVFCPVHLCLGHEAVPVALHECLKPEDWLFSYHRNHGHYLAKGGSEKKLWDEIMGLETGINGGFAGSQGIVDTSINFHASAIVGGLVGVATGTALALKLNKSDAIVVSIVGDAGTEGGVFWESLNFAALHKLPIAYIVENNGKSVDSLIEERQATPLQPRVAAFGVTVRRTVQAAIAHARGGNPSFCEVKVKLTCDHLNMASMPVGSSGGM